MTGDPLSRGLPAVSPRARTYIDQLRANPTPEHMALFLAELERAQNPSVADLWTDNVSAVGFWVLMVSGSGQADEVLIGKELLWWHTVSAYRMARVLCVTSHDRHPFDCCTKSFDVSDFPCLVVSGTPDMSSHLRFRGELLQELAQSPGDLPRFFTKVQKMLENSESLDVVREHLNRQEFWKGAKTAYKEIKTWVTLRG